MIAKPVIDIMFGVALLAASKLAIECITHSGYRYKADVVHWLETLLMIFVLTPLLPSL